MISYKKEVEIGDECLVHAKVFRLFSRDGTGACQRELWVRFDWANEGWVVSFYKKFGQRNAIDKAEPLTEISADVADLAVEAFRRLAALNASGETASYKP